jgi:hypothetical protein
VRVDVHSRGGAPTVVVEDTGMGIAPGELPHVFERFYRGSRANEARGSGSGLGLAIVKSIVDMHGGHVTVESGAGAGSRFTVMLPNDPRTVASSPAAHLAAVASAAEGSQRVAEAVDPTARPEAMEPAPPTALAGPPDGSANMTETSPSDASQMNPASAP